MLTRDRVFLGDFGALVNVNDLRSPIGRQNRRSLLANHIKWLLGRYFWLGCDLSGGFFRWNDRRPDWLLLFPDDRLLSCGGCLSHWLFRCYLNWLLPGGFLSFFFDDEWFGGE